MLKLIILFSSVLFIVPSYADDYFSAFFRNFKPINELAKSEILQKVNNILPRCSDRDYWENLDYKYASDLVDVGNKYLEYDPSYILPSDYKESFKDDEKSNIFKIQRGRRRALINLVFAECIEYKGRFVAKIADLAWLISEETYWGSPTALFDRDTDSYKLPLPRENYVELYISESAKDLAIANYFLDESLDKYSTRIRERILYEVQTRFFDNIDKLLENYLERFHTDPNSINNWYAWIGKNWLLISLFTGSERDSFKFDMLGATEMLDLFFAAIDKEGSINEGAIYWQAGFGKLYDSSLILAKILGDSSLFSNRKFVASCRFIETLHIASGYFINNSDSDARPKLNPLRLVNMAKVVNSSEMRGIAVSILEATDFPLNTGQFDVFDKRLYELFLQPTVDKVSITAHKQEKIRSKDDEIWLPGLGLFKVRGKLNELPAVFVAKIGSNDESHNHNDVGVFELYVDDKPFVVDPGRQAYDLNMFGPDRYTEKYWFHTSSAHNVAILGGTQQAAGSEFYGEVNNIKLNKNLSLLDANIEHAYPKVSNVTSYNRKYIFDKGSRIAVVDKIAFSENSSIEERFTTPLEISSVRLVKPGLIQLENDGTMVDLQYDPLLFSVSVEEAKTDILMRASWKNGLRQIIFRSIDTSNDFYHGFTFKVSN